MAPGGYGQANNSIMMQSNANPKKKIGGENSSSEDEASEVPNRVPQQNDFNIK